MAFDTKYRPRTYGDVLGQDATADVLRQFVKEGRGFQQSYLFCGAHGSGKTTMGRILARALLCENPQNGEPCDQCESCISILERGSSECFSEMDAATKSGKENITRITEEIQYSTFAGTRRVYLFDEAHRLSPQALDALLKPMEDEASPDTDDKQLVCILCTTEPEKMRGTVFSRCAPAFSIRVVPPEGIADRLAYVCEQEKIEYEREALVTLAEVTESHIRDALKAVEGVSMLGGVTGKNITRYLRLDVNDSILKMLAYIGTDVGKSMALAEEVCQAISPLTVYERLAELSMLAYKVRLGATKAPAYWRPEHVAKLGKYHGDYLVSFAQCFASRVGRPTQAMLALDLARIHQVRTGEGTVSVAVPAPPPPQVTPPPNPQNPPPQTRAGGEVPANGTSETATETPNPPEGTVDTDPPESGEESSQAAPAIAFETPGGVHVDPRAIRKGERSARTGKAGTKALDPTRFRDALSARVVELRAHGGGRPEGPHHLGGAGTHADG